jgi:nucleotide-binding universal stress UspA family protein
VKRFKNILYIVDQDITNENVIAKKVITLARLNNASVTVVSILEDGLFEQFNRSVLQNGKELTNMLTEQLSSDIHRFISDDKWSGIKVSGKVLQGKGFISIIQKVLRDRHDLIIKRGSSRRGIDQLSMRLIRKCPCPIWIVKGKESRELTRILGAVDVATDNQETKLLNKKIVELSYSLAQREGGEAHYLHAWHMQAESMLRGPRFKFSDSKIEQMKKQLEKESRENLSSLLESLHIECRPSNMHVLEGKTDTVIEKVLESLQIDVLVVGTIGRSGIPGLLIGNTVEKLLTRVPCSVLAVKPDGYESPVTI